MRVPLVILALLSICGGWIGVDLSKGWIEYGTLQRFSRSGRLAREPRRGAARRSSST